MYPKSWGRTAHNGRPHSPRPGPHQPPTKDSKKYWETKEFKKLNYEWKMKLYEAGHDDIERSGDDGPMDDPQGWPNKAGTLLPLQSGASDFEMEAEGDESLESEQVQSSVDSINDVARDSLNDPETWKGLPAKAKRWWALQVSAAGRARGLRTMLVLRRRS
jgi:hypothetical protein